MMRGIVIGKFMPVHAGHVALIRFASTQCDELIVSMSYRDDDSIPGNLRFSWLNEIFKDDSTIKLNLVKDDFDTETLAWPERTNLWASFLRKQYGAIDVIISSEDYGPLLADHLSCKHISFDLHRKQIPVSAALIRQKPFTYWEFIPEVVRPYFVKKICFYGPESTGKSFMAEKLAAYYHTEWVPEVSRELVDSNEFTVEDIIKIGIAQTQRVFDKTKTANRILFCDSDLITTQIYSRHYLKEVPPILFKLEKQIIYDHYFLFDIDVPWVNDGLRDLGERRKEMFEVFKAELEARKIPYILVKGNFEERTSFVKKELTKILNL